MLVSSLFLLWSRAAGGVVLVLAARQLVGDGDLAGIVGGEATFLAGLGRAQHPSFGVELVRGLGDLVVVEVGGELDAGAAGADHRGDDVLDLLAHPLLEGGAALVADRGVGIGLGAVGEQLPGLVDDRDPLRLQPVDGGGDDVADSPDLLRLQRATHPEHDRSGGLRRLAREQRLLRQYQMDARGLDAVDGADGAGELALQRPQMIDVLDEARGAQGIRLVEDLVADAAALGHAALGELHPEPRHLVLRHHDCGAVIAQLERDRLAFQLLDDSRGILGRQVGEEGGHLWRRDAHDDEGEEADQGRGDRNHGREAGRTKTSQESNQTLHQRPPGFGPRGSDWANIA
ncbi:hypothetical protein ACVW1B_005899 [Bradyrhizobium sp. USDA 4502]